MNKILLTLFLALPAYPVSAQLAEQEQALIEECGANIDPGQKLLSPETADKCVKGLNEGVPEPLLTRYSVANPAAAGVLIGNNNALLDLKEIVVRQTGYRAAQALARVLEKPNCALCDMALGPRPEDTFEWVGKYASDRLFEVKRGVRTWEALGNYRKTSLSSSDYGQDKATWNDQDIMSRYSELSTWAGKETDKLAAVGAKGSSAKKDLAGRIAVLREDLIFAEDAPFRDKLDALEGKADDEAGKKQDETPSPSAKKTNELAGVGDRLAAITPDGQGDYLAQTFDRAAAARPAALPPGAAAASGAAASKPAVAPVPMTAAQEAKLGSEMIRMEAGKPAGYLADVMGKTEAGKRTVAFFSDPRYAKAGSNKLDFGFTREPGVFGYWDPGAKNIRINSEVAEEFAAERGMTVTQLMKDKAAMKDLALYLSPTMVHESEHQNQSARAIAAGTDYQKFSTGSTDPYTRAKENLSNTESAKHIVEYCSKNGGAACYGKFHPMHADNAEKFMAGGVEALDTLKAPLYPRIDSFEGGTAREFKTAQAYAAQLQSLETMQRSSPSGLTARQKLDLKNYRDLMNTRFKWYTMSYQENAVNDTEALAFRQKYGSAGPGLSVPTL